MSEQQSSLPVDTEQKRRARGRQESDGTEAVIELQPLKKGIANLMNLKSRADSARAALNDSVKAIAEQTGLNSSAVRKLVNARSGESFGKAKRVIDQCALIFEECGEETFSNLDVGNGKPRKEKLQAADGSPPAVDPMKGTDLEGVTGAPPGLDPQRLAEADKDAKDTADRKAARLAKTPAGVH